MNEIKVYPSSIEEFNKTIKDYLLKYLQETLYVHNKYIVNVERDFHQRNAYINVMKLMDTTLIKIEKSTGKKLHELELNETIVKEITKIREWLIDKNFIEV